MRRVTALLCTALAGLLTACQVPSAQGGTPDPEVPGYRLVRDFPLPGDASRWDYQVLDPASGRLYVAHTGAGEVVVFGLSEQRVLGTVPGVEAVHGLALAPGLGRLYASATARDEVAAIDLASWRVVARMPGGESPDGIAYVSSAGRLYVSDVQGTGDAVIDVTGGAPTGHVELGAGIGNTQYDPWSGQVLVAVGGRRELAAIDPQSQAVVARHPLRGCEGAHGVQVDVFGRDRVFVACEANARLLALDLAERRVVASMEVGERPDVLALDPGLHRLYVAAESGLLTVVDTAGAEPRVLTRGSAGPDAHSVSVDPDSHLVYLPLAGVGGGSVLRVLAPR